VKKHGVYQEKYRKLVWFSSLCRLFFGPFIFVSVWVASIVTLLLDTTDGELFKRAHFPYSQYSFYDKILDYYWYVFILAYVFVNQLASKWVFLGLFLHRSLGQAFSVLTKNRKFLFIFPNIFEFFFYFYLLTLLFPKLRPLIESPRLIYSLAVIALLKLANEYFLHIKKFSFHNWLFPKKASYWTTEKR